MQQTHPFDPIVNARSKVLILGSFPSLKSFELNFYYAHPRNQFWPIVEKLFDVTLPDNEARHNFALDKGIAMWDTYGALERTQGNSSDANLANLQPNDIPALLKKYPSIKSVFCTGKKSYEGIKKFFPDLALTVTLLPSTSPAYAILKFDAKLKAYEVIKERLEAD
ncbi:MAG: DNA-deoxyinosine glycosylase [Campylobacterota bacterium]|nr:DNA-deoxyinosine glycosylase [Campylobacterota bacterium]